MPDDYMPIRGVSVFPEWGSLIETVRSYPPPPIAAIPEPEETDELIRDSELPDESLDDVE
jgi:hypothetical protein